MIPKEEFKKNPRVLILGKGPAALETATQLVSLGYETVPVHLDDPNQFLRIEGFAGDFQVQCQSGEKQWTESVGAVVFAPELIPAPNLEVYHLAASDQIIGLDDLTILFSPSSSPGETEEPVLRGKPFPNLPAFGPSFYIAFLIGFHDEGHVAETARALSLALRIRKETLSQVCIFCSQVKVAEEGMERLYQACRDEGVLFFKFGPAGPEIVRSGDSVSLEFIDAVLEQPFSLTPDLLVLDSSYSLPRDVREAALSAQIGMDERDFLQPANVHLLPQASERAGIFVAGSGKGPILPEACVREARAAALSVHHFFEGKASDRMNREVTVDKGLCTLCLTCLRYCPHRAIGFTHRVTIHPFACQRCGICAAECPMDAIQINGCSDQEVESKLTALQERWAQDETGQPRLVVFGCQRSAGAAWEEAQSGGYRAQGGVEFIPLPCAGKLDPDYVLKSLVLGADGVLVLSCPTENCQSLHGNTYARERIKEAQNYIEEAGLNPDQIRFGQVSSNRVWYLKEVVDDFMTYLNKSSVG